MTLITCFKWKKKIKCKAYLHLHTFTGTRLSLVQFEAGLSHLLFCSDTKNYAVRISDMFDMWFHHSKMHTAVFATLSHRCLFHQFWSAQQYQKQATQLTNTAKRKNGSTSDPNLEMYILFFGFFGNVGNEKKFFRVSEHFQKIRIQIQIFQPNPDWAIMTEKTGKFGNGRIQHGSKFYLNWIHVGSELGIDTENSFGWPVKYTINNNCIVINMTLL